MNAMDALVAAGAGAAAVMVPACLLVRRAWMWSVSVSRELATLRRQVTRDGLTGLLNRAGFTARAAAIAAPVVVALVDLDGFKEVNDRYGHAAGDTALVAMACHLRRVCGPDGFAGRLGGDEFAVALPAGDAGERLAAIAAGAPVRVTDDVTVTVRGSVGAVAATAPYDLAVVLAQADAAMYRAKHTGAGVAWHDPARDDDTAAGVRPLVRTRNLTPVLKAVA